MDSTTETYLSLVTVLIMCAPGIAFLVQMWRKRNTKRKRSSTALPFREERTWPPESLYEAMYRPPTAPRHHSHQHEGHHPAFDRLSTRSLPNVSYIELVSDPRHSSTKFCSANILILGWQDDTAVSFPQSAHVRP